MRTTEEFTHRADETVKLGFTAIKFDSSLGPWRLFISKVDKKPTVNLVKAIRQSVTQDIDIL